MKNIFQRRWICQTHVLPSSLEEYHSPNSIGAFVTVVGDAENEEEFTDIVYSCLENKMKFPILEIKNIEPLLTNRNFSPELEESIKNLLPVFPIAFSSFYFYTSCPCSDILKAPENTETGTKNESD
jgi:hypothetical protein